MAGEDCTETFLVTVQGEGVDIRREISADKLPLVLNVVMGNAAGAGVYVRAGDAAEIPKTSKLSIREFLDEANASTKPDQIVAIGHYIAVHEGRETFSRDDIKARFQSARERLPSNFPRDFGVAVGKAMIAEDHQKSGQYYVTKTGIHAVEHKFSS